MKKGLIALAVIAFVTFTGVAFADDSGSEGYGGGYGGYMMGPGYGGYGGHMMGPGYGGYMMGPGYGGYMMGPGYGGYGRHMMGPGYRGYMMGPGYGGPCWSEGPASGPYEGKALTKKDAESIAHNYIGRNPNLKVGKIEDKDIGFEAEIVTKDNSLVTKLFIDKTTGWTKSIY